MRSLLALFVSTLFASLVVSQRSTENIPNNLPQVEYKLCATTFNYKQQEYIGCIEVDSPGKPWCQLAKPHGKAKQTRGFCKVESIPKALSVEVKGVAVECNPSSNTPLGKVYGCYTEKNKSKKYLCDVGSKTVECEGFKNDIPGGRQVQNEIAETKSIKKLEQGKGNEAAVQAYATQTNPNGESVPKGLIVGLASAGCVGLLAAGLFMVRKRSVSRQLKTRLYENNTLESSEVGLSFSGHGPVERKIHSKGPFLVVSTYTPTLGDEMEILPGDMVTLLLEYDDGWAQGVNESRGKVKGVFPKHCLEPWA
ncbi:hypothetical protein K7432_001668 [Basidiobolus ranarum]|uniref:SH3 domain-containing protein n=1 Tax=Basidiobolus ranarum TaxID=34480 RepID=A0ABR2X2S0_9FUNG